MTNLLNVRTLSQVLYQVQQFSRNNRIRLIFIVTRGVPSIYAQYSNKSIVDKVNIFRNTLNEMKVECDNILYDIEYGMINSTMNHFSHEDKIEYFNNINIYNKEQGIQV